MPFQLAKLFRTINSKETIFYVFFGLLFIVSCKNEDKSSKKQASPLTSVTKNKDYLSLVISTDTLSPIEFKQAIYKEDSLLNGTANASDNPFFYFFKARKFILAKQPDSAKIEFNHMKSKSKNEEVGLLSDFWILNSNTNNGIVVDGTLVKQILSKIEIAEKMDSKITYMFYDLLAKSYYQNNNPEEALIYAERYYNNHPYKWHQVIKQRYYDISFLLASKMGDYYKMKLYNSQARNLAINIKDSLAVARTYDNEAQIYARQGQFEKALAISKIYFNYLKKSNNLNPFAYNNLAVSFNRNNLPDSAIHYFKEGIAFEKDNKLGNRKSMLYNGLVEAYKMKGDYAEAMQAADSAYTIDIRNITAIEAVKVAELQEKYEVEKKDRNIAELNKRNDLYQKIIIQQRWTIALALLIFMGVASFFYIIYQQQRLKGKNKLLASENKRLNIEQKLLQAQLNPHFVFNSIANLQGLISSGDTQESVRYLTSFSKLLRSILEQNRKDFIDLQEEIDSLENYLQLQQMRFSGLFDYQVKQENCLEDILIPPMLIQPFVENAIEHGFRNINYKGVLKILFRIENEQLIIKIDDNGVGIVKKESNKLKKTSLAQVILKERLDLLFNSEGQQALFTIENKNTIGRHGVLVEIKIPIINH